MHNYDVYCNNCGKNGHQFYQCKIPITSFGVVAFRVNTENTNNSGRFFEGVRENEVERSSKEFKKYEFLMIRRKDTLGYIDFMRGKYTLHNSHYIMNMMKQMTIDEKTRLRTGNFTELWKNLWGDEAISNQYKSEENSSREKYNALKTGIMIKTKLYTLDALLDESMTYHQWTEPEWGFPKGRRNMQETDYECAIREFSEETGYTPNILKNIHNIIPFEENFSGSNYKSYKHKYYLMNISYLDSLHPTTFENTEVSDIGWKSFEECVSCIRPYNLEKIQMISKIHTCLTTNQFYFM
uniref:Nudix hydrolase domain-containing protein n=1 Tax=viral metagenome TaxID=1070528 RepID=A0A6C0JX05_9ZZZZ